MTIEHSQTQNETRNPFTSLYSHQFILLTTFRKNGTSVPTPVWFVSDQGKIYVGTPQTSGKVKRIRNNAKVQVAPCTQSGKVLGETIEGRASLLPEIQYERVTKKLSRKYGILYSVFGFIQKLQRIRPAVIEIASLQKEY